MHREETALQAGELRVISSPGAKLPHGRRRPRPVAVRGGLRRAPPPPRLLTSLLADSGVRLNGDRPWDIQVRDAETYRRILTRGSLGFGEAYMDGLWECARLDIMLDLLLRADLNEAVRKLPRLRLSATLVRDSLVNRVFNRQSPRRALQAAVAHYDIGNDLFQAMLDPTLSYSCGYWARAQDLQQAQLDKLDMICHKLHLKPGERLLDIGCGWGGLARHAAEHFGVEVFGITVSREQLALARERCAGLPVTLEFRDYRELQGRFDKIVSVGMFEHVGPKNYRTFFDVLRRNLNHNGLALLHTIGDSTTSLKPDPWIEKYIFPNGKLPSAQQLTATLEPGLVIRDWHEFGADYDRTLMAWWDNFKHAWPALSQSYSRRFYRMWKYYLHVSAASFRAGQSSLWQVVLTRRGERRDYRSLRP
jgi:cyclopropane-fatty-acyl-phospholipid synthase